jgi:hypothetical protein
MTQPTSIILATTAFILTIITIVSSYILLKCINIEATDEGVVYTLSFITFEQRFGIGLFALGLWSIARVCRWAYREFEEYYSSQPATHILDDNSHTS